MKKIFIAAVAFCLLLSGCGGMANIAGGAAIGTQSSTNTTSSNSTLGALGNILSSVIGLDKITQESLIGTWKYNGPGCAFTSENLLAKAGGEIAASKIEEQLSAQYSKLGLSASNTYIQFKEDGTFAAKIKGKAWNGSYTFDETQSQIQLKGLLLNMTGYVKKETNGISVLFESKKLLSLVQTLSSLSGNSQLSTIGEISKSYDGVRIGFDLKK
ncbi:MAG: DUF4923 family protein [Prevotella sp.]